MFALANPARFQRLARRLSPLAAIAAAALLAAGLYFAILASPADYQQGETVRIMYVHVPAAWMALAAYTAMAGLSVVALIWRHSLADIAAQEIAPIGAGFTLIALVTGALWGRPMWGAYWVWDARLTSVLILFFLFMGHIALARAFDDPARGARAAAILAVVGWINIPVIKFSVEWWNTLHQPASVMRLDGPTIDPAMLLPLGLMAGAFLAIFAWIALARIRARLIERRLEQRLRARAEQA